MRKRILKHIGAPEFKEPRPLSYQDSSYSRARPLKESAQSDSSDRNDEKLLNDLKWSFYVNQN